MPKMTRFNSRVSRQSHPSSAKSGTKSSQDRSSKPAVQSTSRSISTVNARGEALSGNRSMASGPIGRLQVLMNPAGGMVKTPTQRTVANGVGGVRGLGDGLKLKLMRPIPAQALKQNIAGQTINLAQWFANARDATSGTYACTNLPTGMTLNSTTGVISGTPTTVQSNTSTVTVIGVKGTGDQVVTTFTWAVTA